MSGTSNITKTLSRDFARKGKIFTAKLCFPIHIPLQVGVYFLRIPRESLLSTASIAVVPTDIGGVKIYGRWQFMADTPTTSRATCVVCREEKDCAFSLPLARNGKGWESQPVCGRCRAALIQEAKIAHKFVRFFPIEASQKEAERRNGLWPNLGSVLERYARDYREQPKVPEKENRKLKVAKS